MKLNNEKELMPVKLNDKMKVADNMTLEELKMLYELKCRATDWFYIGIRNFDPQFFKEADKMIFDIEQIVKPHHLTIKGIDIEKVLKHDYPVVKCKFNPDLVLSNGLDVCSNYNRLIRNELRLEVRGSWGNCDNDIARNIALREYLAAGIIMPDCEY